MNHPLLLTGLSQHPWALFFRGLAAIGLGVLAFTSPVATIAALVFLFGAYCLVDGVTALVGGIRAGAWQLVLAGVVSIGAALVAFFSPGLTLRVLLYLIAIWAIVRGVFEIAMAIELRKVIDHEWFLILAGVVSVALGVLIFMSPPVAALSLLWVLGVYAFVWGILLVVLSFRVRSLARPVV